MPEGIKEVRAPMLLAYYSKVTAWKEAWETELGTEMSWTEFLVGMSNDRQMWPKGKRA